MLAFLTVVLGFYGGVICTRIAQPGHRERDGPQGPGNDGQTLQVARQLLGRTHARGRSALSLPGWAPFPRAPAWHPSAVCAVQRIRKPAACAALRCVLHLLAFWARGRQRGGVSLIVPAAAPDARPSLQPSTRSPASSLLPAHACPRAGMVLAVELNRTMVLPRFILNGTQSTDVTVTELNTEATPFE